MRPPPSRRGLTPALLALPVFAAFAGLLLLALSQDLDRALAPRPGDLAPADVPQRLRRVLDALSDPRVNPDAPAGGLAQALARHLAPGPDGLAAFKRPAVELLLHLKQTESERERHLLNRACLNGPGGEPACGFRQAAQRHFGVSIHRLHLGEIALLCGLALTPEQRPFPADLSDALETRNLLLARLRDAGAITPAEYEAEIARPLSPPVDHSPVW